jgi:hypothetical protein
MAMSQKRNIASLTIAAGALIVLINCSLFSPAVVKTGDRTTAIQDSPATSSLIAVDAGPFALLTSNVVQSTLGLSHQGQTRLDATADYTGLLIDARDLPNIMRSPAPTINGPAPDYALLYPDRSHVPTPDEVQDESIVRYYHTLDDAEKGVGGSNPLIVRATAVLGNAHDSLEISSVDAGQLLDLDKKIHFTRTWKVGFLIPSNQ